MIIKQAVLSKAITAPSSARANQFRPRKAFYNRVRTDFLRQSARYLRESLNKGKTVSAVYNNNLAHQ